MQDTGRIILQMEIKDVLFHLVKVKPDHGNYIEFAGQYYLVRPHIPEFIEALSPFFDFAVWTNYSPSTCDFLCQYLEALGLSLKYTRSHSGMKDDDTDNPGKRIKRLRYMGIILEKMICLETQVPQDNNHGNYFLIPSYTGQDDEVLLACALSLWELKDTGDTTRLN